MSRYNHPKDTPIEKWPAGWLKLEMASLLKNPNYIIMHDYEKERENYPVTNEQMVEFIQNNRSASNG